MISTPFRSMRDELLAAPSPTYYAFTGKTENSIHRSGIRVTSFADPDQGSPDPDQGSPGPDQGSPNPEYFGVKFLYRLEFFITQSLTQSLTLFVFLAFFKRTF